MTKFTTNKLECRVKRMVKLYKSVYDSNPTSIIIPIGTTFTSLKQYESNNISYVHITSSSNNSEICGLWCPISAVQTRLIPQNVKETEDESGMSIVDEKLTVKGLDVTIYSSLNSMSTVPSSFQLGDILTVDRKTTLMINGQEFNVYHIADTSAEDQTIIGMWVKADSNINDPSNTFTVQSSRSLRKGINLLAAEPTRAGSGTSDSLDLPSWTCPRCGTSNLEGLDKCHNCGYSLSAAAVIAEAMASGGRGSNEDNTSIVRVPTNDANKIPYTSEDFEIRIQDPVTDLTQNNTTTASHAATTSTRGTGVTGAIDSLVSYVTSYLDGGSNFSGGSLGRMLFVHGMPFQYTYITDRRLGVSQNHGKSDDEYSNGDEEGLDSNVYGRSFAHEIAYNIPIASVIAGDPSYFQPTNNGVLGWATDGLRSITGDTAESREAVMNLFGAGTGMTEDIENLLNENGGSYQYYKFEVNTRGYFNHVNSLCLAAAVMLDIQDMKYSGQNLSTYHWENYNRNAQYNFGYFETKVGIGNEVSFAFDPQGSISNTIQNSTQESQLSGMINQLSSVTREISFVAGITGSGMSWIDGHVNEATAKMVDGGSGIVPDGLEHAWQRIKTWAVNSAKGMNIRFPEIWSESNHAPSYEMEMHFISPYATPFCIWRYVLVPFYHIFAFAAPQSDSGAMQYSAPYLIRASSKGYFNVEMGMVDSITWKRFGEGDMITEGGIPTQIDVTVTFKDLYHALSLTAMRSDSGFGIGALVNTNLGAFINNTGLMDLIGTMTGINMNQLPMSTRVELIKAAYNPSQIGSDIRGAFGNTIADYGRSILDRYGIYSFR